MLASMKKTILSMILGVFCLTANAQKDFLVPETGFFSSDAGEYECYNSIRKNLCDGLQEITDARIIMTSLVGHESLVSVDTKDGKSYFTYRELKEDIRDPRFPSGLSKLNDSIGYTEYKMEIPDSIAQSFNKLVFTAISQAKYPDKISYRPPRLESTYYIFFAYNNDYGLRSAQTWDPEPGKINNLISIFRWLRTCVERGERIGSMSQLQKDIQYVTEQFEKQ